MHPPDFSPFRWSCRVHDTHLFQVFLIAFWSVWIGLAQPVWAGCACSEVAVNGSGSSSLLSVDPNSGAMTLSQTDVTLPAYPGFNLTRQYNSTQNEYGMFGFGWRTPWINNLLNVSGNIAVNIGGSRETFILTNDYWNTSHSMQLSFPTASEIVVNGGLRGTWCFGVTNLACTKYVDAYGNPYVFDTTVTNLLTGSEGGTNIYQNLFLINRITFPDSREMSFIYTSNICTQIISQDGHTNDYTYTDRLLTGVSRDNGMALDYGYHTITENGIAKGWLTNIVYANGAEVSIAYNGEFDTTNHLRVVEVDGPHGYVHSYGYETLTNCGCSLKTTLTDSRNNTTIYVTEGVKRRIVTNALGFASTQVSSNGVIVSMTDYRGNTEYRAYDWNSTNISSRMNVICVTNTLGKAWKYGYENNLRSISISPIWQTNRFVYDTYGHLLEITNALGQRTANMIYTTNGLLSSSADGRGNVTHYAYSTEGLMTNVVDALTNSWQQKYDSSGNRVSAIDPLGNVINIVYNRLNKPSSITNALGNVAKFFYDEMASLTNATDALGNVVSFSYDQLQRKTKIRDALGNETKFSYDPESNLAILSNAMGYAYSYAYDPLNHLKTAVYPDTSRETYVHDANGNVIGLTNRAGLVISAEYDEGNRLTSKTWQGVTNVVFNHTYDDADRLLTIVQMKGGVVESAITNTWDEANRLSNQVQGTYTVRYGYDINSSVTNVLYPCGLNVRYTYDALNRLSAVHDSTNALAASTHEFDSAGRPTKFSMENGTETVCAWDAAGRMTNIALRVATTPTNVFWSAAYGYDSVGNRTWVKNRNGRGDVYQYDGNYQITGVKYDVDNPTDGYTSATNPSRTVTYNLDALGNRTSVVENGNSTSYSINNLNQYVSVAGTNLTYDARGNLTGDGTWTFEYDHEDHLVGASKSGTSVCYSYDGFGRRTVKTINGVSTYYIYDAANLIEERDGSGTLLAKYVYAGGIDRPLKVVKGANTYYFQQDALGNVTMLVSASGQAVEQYTYDVFGQPSIMDGSGNTLNTASTPFLFTGREYDSEIGLYHYRARAYSPKLGRFLQADPIGLSSGDANLYRYCLNNPVFGIDPSGTSANKCCTSGSWNGHIDYKIGSLILGWGRFTGTLTCTSGDVGRVTIAGHVNGVGFSVGYISGTASINVNNVKGVSKLVGQVGGFWVADVQYGYLNAKAGAASATISASGSAFNAVRIEGSGPGIEGSLGVDDLLEKPTPGVGGGLAFYGYTITSAQ